MIFEFLYLITSRTQIFDSKAFT